MSKDKSSKSWFGRHKILTVLGVLILIGIIASATNSSKSNTTGNAAKSSSPAKPATKATTAKIGQAANDGKFAFTVNSVKCGETSVGDQYLNRTAQGQYCRLNVTVKNIGDKKQSLAGSDQYLFNAAGQKYSADDTAGFYAQATGSSGGSTWYEDINPGNSVTGDILFDIPKDQTPTSAELHDSAFSGGVKVSLQ
jgi:hypothetical protein